MMDDLISRQAAIDAIVAQTIGYTVDEIKAECEENIFNENGYLGGLKDAIEAIEDISSAQPEPCVDTIDALDESIKHFDDMAEECRRNANIEQNDYMDMRDDAAEYRQLSIWLNELKWLRERFQSQPDMSEYSDKLWKAAYERGKAEAQQRWIPCSERLPDELAEVNITWINTNPAPYYEFTKGKPNTGSAVYYKGRWYWYSAVCADYLAEYGFSPDDDMDDAIKVIAWMPLPEPYAERRTDET